MLPPEAESPAFLFCTSCDAEVFNAPCCVPLGNGVWETLCDACAFKRGQPFVVTLRREMAALHNAVAMSSLVWLSSSVPTS
jgi:hypothetical protein